MRQDYTVNYSEDGEKPKSSLRHYVPQCLVAATVTIGGFSLGNCLGYSSPALPNLESSGDFPNLQRSDLSWIGSLVTIGAICGAFFSGYLIERIGRKKTLLVAGVPFAIGWLTIALAQQIYMLYAGRFLTGFSVGALSLVAPVYLCEISESNIRGFVGAIFQVTVTLGILFTFIVGSVTSWNLLAAFCAIVPLIFIVLSTLLPESPRYLLSAGYTSEAVRSLSWLRSSDALNPSKSVLEEINEIEGAIERAQENKLKLADLISIPVRKPLFITLSLMFFNQFCGANAVGFYTVSIFKEAELGLDAYVSSIIVGAVQVVATLLASIFVDKAGRRALLLASFGTMCISLMTLATFFHVKNDATITSEIWKEAAQWVPLTSVVVFNAAYCGGVGCLVWTVMSEILPSHVIGCASGLATTFNWTLAFVTTKFFHNLNDSLGIHNTFWLFAVACFSGLVFVFVCIPETKGRTLDMIQKENFQTSSSPRSKVDIADITVSAKCSSTDELV